MSNRYHFRPNYPVYQETPLFGGRLPTIDEMGPPDVHPSALNPSYSVYRGAWGRNLAGLGADMRSLSAEPHIKDYANELNLLAAADDVQGNGLFDPHGSPGNIHADYGVFVDHESLPGYVVRDQFYRPSQVIDGTTGDPVMYVPSGAVAIDRAQLDTYRQLNELYEIPPGVAPFDPGHPDVESQVIPREYAWPVSGLGATDPNRKIGIIAGCAILGAAVGIFAATLKGKKKS